MKLFLTALPSEADPIVSALKLKRDHSLHQFQLFRSEDTALIVSGVGKLKAAAAAASLLTLMRENRWCGLNVGICGAPLPTTVGTPFIAHTVHDADSSKNYYPDHIVHPPFEKRRLVTHSSPQTDPTELVDMEASGFFEAASHFGDFHQIQAIKITADNGTADFPPKQFVSQLLRAQIDEILSYAEELHELCLESQDPLHEAERSALLRLAGEYRMSTSMQNRLLEISRHLRLLGDDPLKELQSALSFASGTPKQRAKQILEEYGETLERA